MKITEDWIFLGKTLFFLAETNRKVFCFVNYFNRASHRLFKFNQKYMANAFQYSESKTIPQRLQRWLTLSACVGMTVAATSAAQAEDLAPLKFNYPPAAFVGTKTDAPSSPNLEPLSLSTNRAPFMAPKGLVNLVAGKKPICSDPLAPADKLAMITDGDKDSEKIVLLRKGSQYVQFDLGSPCQIYAILFWHAHDTMKIYHKVIVQVSDNPDFTGDVKTLFNNDIDNTTGHGAGKDKEYFETRYGKLVDAKGVKARYVRLYSKGSTDSAMNEYTEVEVYGRPAK